MFLEEVFVLPLALPKLATESRRKELGSLLGTERSKCLSRLLNPREICDPEISGRLFLFLQRCHPYCALFSDGFCGTLLIPSCTAQFQRCPTSWLHVETEEPALEFGLLWAAPKVI